ncbi:MAG: type IV pilus assembly protein PilM [Acidimicrobiales bacterium]|jgi:type IV pilus assembly protein PilM
MAVGLKSFLASLASQNNAPPKRVVGIDIGSSSVKVVELQFVKNIITLKTYGELQLGPYGERELGRVVQLELPKQVEAVVDILKEAKVKAKAGILTLPMSMSFVTVFSVEAEQTEDIESRVHVEARKYIPVPMAEVALDWNELPSLGSSVGLGREVLVVAVQNDIYNEMNILLQSLQMTSQSPEVELFSALRSVTNASDTSVAVIDLGAQTSKMYISHEGMVRKIHRVFAGGVQATERIAKLLDIPFEEAEDKKRNYTPDGEDAADIKKAVITTFERSFQEFRRVLNQYELRAGAPVARIVITGGTASFGEMQTYASYMLDRQVERANPFTKTAYPAFMEDTLAEVAPIFSIALGAALRPFELI